MFLAIKAGRPGVIQNKTDLAASLSQLKLTEHPILATGVICFTALWVICALWGFAAFLVARWSQNRNDPVSAFNVKKTVEQEGGGV
jgi:hypothetical protein